MMTAFDVDLALAGASDTPFWLDDPRRPAPRPSVNATVSTDLAIVGGGFTGLWSALLAKERNPQRRVVLVEANTLGWAASGRNGGFCSASLTHGYDNGKKHLPEEVDKLLELGIQNLDEIESTIERYHMDCDFERTGEIDLATKEHHVPGLKAAHAPEAGLEWVGPEELHSYLRSPVFLGGLRDRRGNAIVNPAKLVWELARVASDLGVEIYENTLVTKVSSGPWGVSLHTEQAEVRASKVILATNVFPSLVRSLRWHTVPVYDYVLVTEPLSAEQLASIGWENREGLADIGSQFHYFRLTKDQRILWGGWDAIYHFGRRMSPRFDQRPETFRTLARQFHEAFPQLGQVRFTHAWGGAIDTCSRFFPFFHRSHGGRVLSAAGFTGLGVGASRFAAQVMLDELDDCASERRDLAMVRTKPIPFPPEPIAWLGITLTTRALIRSDQRGGRRGPWLKLLDALGMGFDS
ncbi:FAD-binding oxidoreductase [Corynebacterium uropygiale]|uniref:FAD-binding oxidoreductase n=1 Tax=Corynebacterium uropygiale TaxID=1775911 RepID=A0A9X1QQG5_9CORY|nr:FAD-binding oxidoreductase [Corynebacterium uropygiale]MCF4005699.1 FAD-binding oxidoreductase [Corynebacterium uropygiale]